MYSLVASLLLLATSCFAQTQPTPQTLAQNDIHVLQYALILENLEYAFYSKFQAQYSSQDFVNANIGLTATDYSYFNLIRDHELAHVIFLNTSVPSPTTGPCTYNFPVNNVSDYIRLAQSFENLGVSAYDGAINNIYNPDFAQAAATIATIEARHASYLNRINGQNPFPNAFDQALNATTVANGVFGGPTPFATCTLAPGFALPQLYIVYPVQNASDSSQPTETALNANDVRVLQYALFLEHLENAFYAFVLSNFTASSFANSQVYNYLTMIGQHEATHVDVLSQVIRGYGAVPLSPCTYNFSGAINGNVSTAIAIAAALEATGVNAYDGAVKSIYNAGYKEAAATIATVEARHASYINYIAQNAQGPVQGAAGAFDSPLSYSEIVGIVLGTNLLVSCPAVPAEFTTLIVKPYTNATVNYPTTGATTGSTTAAATTGTTGTVAPTGAPTDAPTDAPTAAPTATPTAAPTTSNPTPTPTATPAATTGATTGPRTTTGNATATGALTSTTRGATTSSASIATASVVVALIVAAVAL